MIKLRHITRNYFHWNSCGKSARVPQNYPIVNNHKEQDKTISTYVRTKRWISLKAYVLHSFLFLSTELFHGVCSPTITIAYWKLIKSETSHDRQTSSCIWYLFLGRLPLAPGPLPSSKMMIFISYLYETHKQEVESGPEKIWRKSKSYTSLLLSCNFYKDSQKYQDNMYNIYVLGPLVTLISE